MENEGFVAGVEVHGLQRLIVGEVDAAGLHEREGALDLVRDDLVALALERVGDELLVPRVHTTERGVATRRKGAQQVERRDALVIGGEEPIGVRATRFGVELLGVDDVTAKGGETFPAAFFELISAWLGELAGDASDFDDWHARRVGKGDGHLQDDF